MARTLAQIAKQIESLKMEADRVRESEVAGVVQRIKVAIADDSAIVFGWRDDLAGT